MPIAKKLAVSAGLVASIAVVSKFLGFFREIALAFYFGAGVVTDAYLVATAIPGFFYFCVGAALTTAFIPVYSKVSASEGARKEFLGSLLALIFVVCTVLVVLLILNAGELVAFIAPGLDQEGYNLARRFTQIFAIGIFLTAAINVLTSILHVHGLFAVPALSGLVFSLSVLLSIIFAYQYGVIYLILGPLLGKGLEVVLMLPFARRAFSGVIPRFQFSDPNIKAIIVLVGPMALGLAGAQANLIVDRVFGSQVESGAISALSYAFALANVVVSVISVSVASVIYPSLARMSASQMSGSAISLASKALGIVLVWVVPAAAVLAIFREDVVSVVFGRGRFDSVAVENTSVALGFYALGIVGLTVREIITRIYYARGKPLFPALNVLCAAVLNAALTFWWTPLYGIAGIACATLVSVCASVLWLAFDALKSLGTSELKQVLVSGGVICLGVATAACGLMLFEAVFSLGWLWGLLLFLSLYGLTLFLLREPFSRFSVRMSVQAIGQVLKSRSGGRR